MTQLQCHASGDMKPASSDPSDYYSMKELSFISAPFYMTLLSCNVYQSMHILNHNSPQSVHSMYNNHFQRPYSIIIIIQSIRPSKPTTGIPKKIFNLVWCPKNSLLLGSYFAILLGFLSQFIISTHIKCSELPPTAYLFYSNVIFTFSWYIPFKWMELWRESHMKNSFINARCSDTKSLSRGLEISNSTTGFNIYWIGTKWWDFLCFQGNT